MCSCHKAQSLEQLLANPAAFRGIAQVDAGRFSSSSERSDRTGARDRGLDAAHALHDTTLHHAERGRDDARSQFQLNADLALVGNVHIAKQYLICQRSEEQRPRLGAWSCPKAAWWWARDATTGRWR